jgi:hypothetical protein
MTGAVALKHACACLPVPTWEACTRGPLRFSSPSNSLDSVRPLVVSVLRSIRSLVRSRAGFEPERSEALAVAGATTTRGRLNRATPIYPS